MMISLPISSLAAIANGALLLVLTFRVINLRRKGGVVLGDNGDRALAKAIRGQANAAEQMPMALLLMALFEVQGGAAAYLALMAVMFSSGRVMHGIYFGLHGTHWRLRFFGMWSTIIAQAGLLLGLIWSVVL